MPFPCSSRSSIGAFSHILIECSMSRSIERQTEGVPDAESCRSIWTNRRRIRRCSPRTVTYAPSASRLARFASVDSTRHRDRVRFKDRLQNQLGGSLHCAVPNSRNPERPFPPPGFGIMTLRTGCGLYTFARSSFLMRSHHSTSPCDSICSDFCPSRPGAPLLAFAKS